MLTPIHHAELRAFAGGLLLACGSHAAEAMVVADHLVDANLAGHDSHGIGMLPLYLDSVRRGKLFVNRVPRVVNDFAAIQVFEGDRGFGHPAARSVLDCAMQRAGEFGVALVALRNSGHVGRLGAHGEYVAAAGYAALLLVNATGRPPSVAPHGGSEPRLSSNPFCFAYPALEGMAPVVLDAATAGMAIGKARVARAVGQPLPPGLLLDDQGRPTTDPRFALGDPQGALLPFGLHKGSGLGLFCDLFAGALCGAETAQPGNGNQTRMGATNNMLAIVIDPARLGERDNVLVEARAMLDYFKSSRPTDPAQPVMLPGEIEARTRTQRLADGITIDAATWKQLTRLAQDAGVAPPQADTATD